MVRGLVLFARTPSWWLVGFVPVLISLTLIFFLTIALAFLVDDVTLAVTPFADAWPAALRTAVRIGVGITVFASFAIAVVITFATVTNLIGQPFFEILGDYVEKHLGDAPPGVDAPWWKTLPRATFESLCTFAAWLLVAIPLFALGLLPFVGQTVIPVVELLVFGWFMALEIVQIPLERRGHRFASRMRWHWARENRWQLSGFGAAALLLFLVPLMNVLAMPGAIVGAILLARHLRAPIAEGDDARPRPLSAAREPIAKRTPAEPRA